MTENEITGDILDASIKLHRQFGAGLLESVYETLLEIELKKRGHKVERQKTISFEYEGVMLENYLDFTLCASASLRENNSPQSTERSNP